MFFISSRDSIRRHAFQVALEIALNTMILAGLIIIQPIVRRLAGRLVSVVAITPVLPPIYDSHCNRSSLSLQDMSIYAIMLGSFVYSLLSFSSSLSQDGKEQVQAILGILVKKTIPLATVFRECIGRLLRTAAYPVKIVKTAWITLYQDLRSHLGTMPKYPGFRACLNVTTRLLIATFCLLFFGLSVSVVMPCHHHQPFSRCARSASCDLPFVALDITDRAETLFNTVFTAVPFLFEPRFLVGSLLSSVAVLSYRHMKARSRPSLLINDDEKEDSANHELDERPAESDKDTLCDTIDLKVDVDDRDVSSQIQEAVSVPNDGKEDGLNQRNEAVISWLSSATEDLKHKNGVATGPPFCAGPVRSRSLQHQQVQNFGSKTRPYRSSLSASSQEFVPRFRNRVICAPAHSHCPPHWAPAPPVSVRITAPVKQGAHQQNAETVVSPMILGRL